jgi:hypothetical protein
MKPDTHMLAYCGLYCEQCSFKAAYEENDIKHLKHTPSCLKKTGTAGLSQYACECCKGYSICGPCKIRDCASVRNIDSCADCADFPCAHINAFEDDGLPHHANAINDLRSIRIRGFDKWFESLAPELNCACGERQSWYYKCMRHN